MEKIRSLIEKINLQFSQKLPLEQLLVTVQMLHKEISGNLKEVDVLGTTGISVMVPNAKPVMGVTPVEEPAEPMDTAKKEYFELVMDESSEADEPSGTAADIPTYEELLKLQKEIGETLPTQAKLSFLNEAVESDLPTLSRQNKPVSKAAKQTATPRSGRSSIKDLAKAITAQDRISFVRLLFRGDETMFDRSIKTINNFSSLAEAQYWIKRELFTKNGWLAANPTVQQFEQLVKRRFS